MQGEHPVEVAELENATNPRLGDHELEFAVEQANPFEGTDEHPETERVDEVDAGEVEHDVMKTSGHGAHHVLAQLGRPHHVEFAGDGEDRPAAFGVCMHDDVHRPKGTGPHPCDSVTGES